MRGHPLYVYHKNLLDHIGMHSSFAIRPDRLPFPRCYESMSKVWSIHPLERFNVSLLLLVRKPVTFSTLQQGTCAASRWSVVSETAREMPCCSELLLVIRH